MTDIEVIEKLIKNGNIFEADVLCNDKKISYIDLLMLLSNYIDNTQ